VTDDLLVTILLQGKEVVAGNEDGETEARGGPVWVIRSMYRWLRSLLRRRLPVRPRDHRLRISGYRIVLHDESGPDFRGSCVGERESTMTNIATPDHGFLPYFVVETEGGIVGASSRMARSTSTATAACHPRPPRGGLRRRS